MSAESCIVHYGLRFDVLPEDLEAIETRTDPRVVAARKAGLRTYFGNFAAPDERYLLFIGSQTGVLGPENDAEVELDDAALRDLATSVRIKLAAAGLSGEPRLYVQWEPDA